MFHFWLKRKFVNDTDQQGRSGSLPGRHFVVTDQEASDWSMIFDVTVEIQSDWSTYQTLRF